MAAMMVLAYGAMVYIVFLATLLYSVAFVGDLGVARSIDHGTAAPFGQALLADLILLSLFAVQHSTMARQAFKRWWTRLIPPAAERSTYVLVSSLLLALLFWQWRPLPEAVWRVGGWGAIALQGLFWCGWLLVLISSFAIDHFDLFGLRQAYLNFRGMPCPPPEFRVSGLYRHLRHPLLAGFIVAFWATPEMTLGHLIFALATTGYMAIGILFEERDLIALYGEPYAEYRRHVWAVLPLPLGSVDESFSERLLKGSGSTVGT